MNAGNNLHKIADALGSDVGIYSISGFKVLSSGGKYWREWSAKSICFNFGDIYSYLKMKPGRKHQRLPYPHCYVEFDISSTGSRVGLLCHQKNPRYDINIAVFFLCGGVGFLGHALCENGTNNIVFTGIDRDQRKESVDNLKNSVFAALCGLDVLSCSNVKTIEHEPPVRLNKKRVKKGKLPLFSTHTLHFAPGSRSDSEEKFQLEGKRNPPRVHLRRGHIRTCSSGKVVWVQPCAVGNPAAGIVHKDYSIDPSGGEVDIEGDEE